MAKAFSSWGVGAFLTFASAPTVHPDHVRFRSLTDLDLSLTVPLDEGDITASGYPVRDTLARPTSSTPAGAPPLQVRIPLLFDNWLNVSRGGTQYSIEPDLRKLDKLYGRAAHEAPIILVEGRSVPYSFEREPQLRWALTGDPEFGEVQRKANGDRVYAEVAVTVVEVPDFDVVPNRKNPKPKFYVVPKHGGHRTLKAIAHAHHTTWDKLRRLNPKHKDPAHVLKAKTKIRVA